MDDRQTPMEAEVQELYVQMETCPPEDFYGTSCKPKTCRSHTGLWTFFGLTVIAFCTVSVFASLSQVRLTRGEGGWNLSMQNPEETQRPEKRVQDLHSSLASDYRPSAGTANAGLRLELGKQEGESLPPEQIYRQNADAVVCIQCASYYGSSVYTGVVISSDGYILSAGELLTGSGSFTVQLADDSNCSARRVGYDRSTGICLLKIEAQDLPTVSFADAENLSVGQSAYCISNPYGSQIRNVFSEGMLCVRQTILLDGENLTILQTTAQMDGAGCGCPIFDGNGQVVGLTSTIGKRILSGAEDPCFAVSSADLARIVPALESSEPEGKLWLGLEVDKIPEEQRFFYGFPGKMWIVNVADETPPYGTLFQFDVITAVDDIAVSGPEDYQQILNTHSPGDWVKLTIYRNGRWYEINLPVISR
ncbi:MAG: serine protease [Oscillospiraceae bacterium]|nr:serine protease [Oscillospiraceae bacterium]